MTSARRIYWPRSWEQKVGSGTARFSGGVILTGLLAACGVLMLVGAARLPAVLILLLAAWLVPVMAGVYWLSIGRGRRGWDGNVRRLQLRGGSTPAVILPFSWLPKYAYLWLLLGAGIACAAAPYLASAIPYDGSYRSGRFHAVAPYFPILSVLVLPFLGSRLFRRRGQLGIGLSPDGVYSWSWFGCCFYAWDWIGEVRPTVRRGAFLVELDVVEPNGVSSNPEETLLARFDSFREYSQRIPVGFLKPNPAVSLYAIEFYRRHPELRHELGTDKGVERIRDGDLPDVVLEVYNNGRFVTPSGAAE